MEIILSLVRLIVQEDWRRNKIDVMLKIRKGNFY